MNAADRDRLTFSMGPLTVDFDEFVGAAPQRARVPHLGHRGRLRRARPPPARCRAVVVDNLGLIARFTGRPTGDDARRSSSRTTDPVARLHRPPDRRRRRARRRRGRRHARPGAARRGVLPPGLRPARPGPHAGRERRRRRCSTRCAPSSRAPSPSRAGAPRTARGRPAQAARPRADAVARGEEHEEDLERVGRGRRSARS